MLFSMLTSPMSRNALLMFYALRTPGDHVLIGSGSPGIGKTKFARSVAKAIGADDSHFLRWSVGQHGPEDFNGWPVPRPDGLRFEAPYAVKRINDGRPAVWMLDELSLATRTTQGAMLRLMDERYCGDERLNDNVKLIGMMNPPEHAADVQEISKPLANRAVWFDFLPPSKEDHVAYEMGEGSESLVFPAFDRAEWDDSRAEVVGVYAGYMQARGVLVEDLNSDSVIERFPLAYATPRSWSYALNIAATCRMYKDDAAMMTLLQGTVGKPQALEFMAYYKTMDLVAPKLMVERPELFEVNPARPDRTFAQCAAVARWATEKRATDKEAINAWHGGWKVMKYLLACKAPKDLLLPSAAHLGANKPKGQMLTEYLDTVQLLAPMVMASGMNAAAIERR